MVQTNNSLSNIEANIADVLKGKDPLNTELWETLLRQHPADIADMVERLSEEHQTEIIKKFPEDIASKVFEYLPGQLQVVVLSHLTASRSAHILQNMPADELTDLFELLPDDDVKKYLKQLQTKQRKQVISLLHFDPQSAGGIMNSDALTLRTDFTIKKSISLLQKIRPKREDINKVYVTDKDNLLVGHLHLDELVLNKPDITLKNLVHKNALILDVNDDQEEVAKLMKHYALHSAPVVDKNNHFLGVITADDVFNVIEQEQSEDMYKISGVNPIDKSYFQTPFWRLIWQRSPWLIGLLLLQSVSGFIMANYNDMLDRHIILSHFITMLIGTGGNAGNQTGALVIRGLTTGEIKVTNGIKVLLREFRVSLAMSGLLSVIAFVRVMFTHSDPMVAFAISLSLFLITVASMIMGALLPLMLEKFKFDPANSAQPFLATLMDIIGILIYCMIASRILC